VEIDQVKATDDNDLEMLTTFGEYGGSKTHLLQRLAEGQHCYVAKSGGRIIAVNWAMEGEFGEDLLGRRFKLADDELYYGGAFTLPEFRSKGIMAYMKTQSISDIKTRSQHKTRALAFIETGNKASLCSTAKVGFRRVGRVGFVEIFGIRFHYLFGRSVLPETARRFFIERR
jgi:GNAT superfamily N-acetyltransferase